MSAGSNSSDRALYAADLSAWADSQVEILQGGRWDSLDRKHLADVIDRLGARERGELQDRLGVIITGLLRWAEQVDLRCHGWAASIDAQRQLVDRLLRDSPSLKEGMLGIVADAYGPARTRAVLESGLFDSSFSESCPFSASEILTDSHFPDPYGDDAVRGEGWWKRR